MAHRLRTIFAGAVLALCTSMPAMALDAEDFGAKFVSLGRMFGVGVSYDHARAEGDRIVLSGISVSLPDAQSAKWQSELVFDGVTEAGDGGYRVSRASMADIDVVRDEARFRLSDIAVENVNVPGRADPENAREIMIGLFETFRLGPLSATPVGRDEPFISWKGMRIWNERPPGLSFASGYEITGIEIALGGMAEGAKAVMQIVEAFGIDRLQGALRGYARWHEDGRMTLDEMSLDFTDLGRLDLNMAMTGYTPEIDTQMSRQAMAMLERTESGKPLSPAEIEEWSKGPVTKLPIESISIRYDDAGLFPNALALFAGGQGRSDEEVKTQIKAMLRLNLLSVLSPATGYGRVITGTDYAGVVTPAEAFIDDPRNIQITLTPQPPLSLEEIQELATRRTPGDMRLGLSVEANR